jgi:hypothetical protein
MSKPSYRVRLVAISDRGKPFLVEQDNGIAGAKSGGPAPSSSTSVRVRDEEMANRVAIAFRRAAVLCGAPSQPVGTGLAVVAQSPPSEPGSPGTSTITNAAVIQLVNAGLSEQVIATSIRQAPKKDFDLTPAGLIALKKAHVSDALISAMQNSDTAVQAASASDAKVHPKYDPTLAAPPKSAAAPESQDGCSGIESMGIYKNEIFDRAMGGGVVEWLAKIRNNTGVTKIVVVGWLDTYGQQQRAQVQIRGGEIASPRLDLTQAKMIPPVTDLRVLSCQ